MRVLALDYGRGRCGCAVSDPTGVLASPIDAVRRPMTRRGLSRLRTLVRELGAERVVVGLPVSLSGRDSAQTEETRAFAACLERELPVPVELYDERFTTRLAQRTGGRAQEDSRAAAHLLESWLASQPGHAEVGRDHRGAGQEAGNAGQARGRTRPGHLGAREGPSGDDPDA
jgi:putative holliday junction resolvase